MPSFEKIIAQWRASAAMEMRPDTGNPEPGVPPPGASRPEEMRFLFSLSGLSNFFPRRSHFGVATVLMHHLRYHLPNTLP